MPRSEVIALVVRRRHVENAAITRCDDAVVDESVVGVAGHISTCDVLELSLTGVVSNCVSCRP